MLPVEATSPLPGVDVGVDVDVDVDVDIAGATAAAAADAVRISTGANAADGTVSVDTVDAQAARQLVADDASVRIIDVRSGAEFAAAHIPGSFNIPVDTLREHVEEVAGLDHPVLLVCQSGARARSAHAHLANAGKNRVHVLDGGIGAWQVAGGEVRTASTKVWAMERQVRFAAGLLVFTGLLVGRFAPKARGLSLGVASGLMFSAATDTCAMATVLGRLPHNRGAGCDIDEVLGQLRAS